MNKKFIYINKPLALVAGLFFLTGCKGFFGEKTKIDFIEVPKYDSGSIAYVPILPALTGLSEPSDVVAGFDELVYVVDRGKEEIVSFDQSGRRLQSLHIPGVKAVAQDRRLQLIALGAKDTIVGDATYRLDALYRIQPNAGGAYGLNGAKILKVTMHPFYFRSSFSPLVDVNVHLNDVAVLADNSYYVTRSGPSDAPNQFGGPDNTVLYFSPSDEWQGTMYVQSSTGTTTAFFKNPYGIVTGVQPPATTVDNTKNFYVTSLSPFQSLKVQAIKAETSEDYGTLYSLATDLIVGDTSKADGFLYTAGRFRAPYGIGFQTGATNSLFVTDREKDSLYVFSTTGLEGVRPPAGSTRLKYIKVSLGGTGNGPTQFRRPEGVAIANQTVFVDGKPATVRTVYVCDAGNGRVSRFRLTTDLQ